MAFGNEDNKGKGRKADAEVTPEGTANGDTPAVAPEGEAKPEPVVIPEGYVKVTDFAAELTFKNVAERTAKGEAPTVEDYVSVQEIYTLIQAGMPSGHFGEGKQGKRVQRAEALKFLETYVPAKRGRAAMAPEDKVKSDFTKILAKAKELGIDISALTNS